MPILLDTGCNISCLRSSFVNLTSPVASGDVLLTSVNTTPMTVVGKWIITTFQIQDLSYSKTVYLVKDLASDLLLGKKFLLSNNTKINFNHVFFSIWKRKIVYIGCLYEISGGL